jgi:hypothetical protein
VEEPDGVLIDEKYPANKTEGEQLDSKFSSPQL